MLLLELVRRETAAQSAKMIDCLTDMPWHRNWRMERRIFMTATLYPRSFWPVLTGYLPALAKDYVRATPLLRCVVQQIRNFAAATERD
jgi:hypothetical protein